MLQPIDRILEAMINGSITPLCFVFTLLFFVINVSIAGDAQACQHPGPTIDDWSSGLTATSESSFPVLAS